MTDDIAPRILDAIVRASSKRPARASEVLARLDAPAPESEAALDRLIASRQVATARIQRRNDPEPWLAIWPTGVIVHQGAWSNAAHSGIYTPHPPIRQQLREASTPRVAARTERTTEPEEPAMKTNTPRHAKGALRLRLIAEMNLALGGPLTPAQLAERTGSTIESCRITCRKLVAIGEMEEVLRDGRQAFQLPLSAATPSPEPVPSVAGITVTDIEAEQIEAAPAPAVEAPEQSEPLTAMRGRDAASPAPEVHFALWDDGQLTIDDGDQIIVLPPNHTVRLAALLGVPLELGR